VYYSQTNLLCLCHSMHAALGAHSSMRNNIQLCTFSTVLSDVVLLMVRGLPFTRMALTARVQPGSNLATTGGLGQCTAAPAPRLGHLPGQSAAAICACADAGLWCCCSIMLRALSSTSSPHLAAVTWITIAVAEALSTLKAAGTCCAGCCDSSVNVRQGCAVVAAATAIVHVSCKASLRAAAAATAQETT
jgi:hypothetical protein